LKTEYCVKKTYSFELSSPDGGDVSKVSVSIVEEDSMVKFGTNDAIHKEAVKVTFEMKDDSQLGKTFTVEVYASAGTPEKKSPPYTITRVIKSLATIKVAEACEVERLEPMIHLSEVSLEWFTLQ
jgi:hypothetical protein